MVFYANMPFDADNPACQDGNYPNGLISDGEINGGLSHEHMESVTDPIPNDAWTNGAGALHGFEIGDLVRRRDGHPARHRPQRLAVQPGDQRAPLLVPGGVEQLHPQLRAACDAAQEPADGEGDGHRGQRDRHDVRRQSIDARQAAWPSSAGSSTPLPNAETVEQTTPTITYTFPAPGRVLHRRRRVQRRRTVGRNRRDRGHGQERVPAGVHGLAGQAGPRPARR